MTVFAGACRAKFECFYRFQQQKDMVKNDYISTPHSFALERMKKQGKRNTYFNRITRDSFSTNVPTISVVDINKLKFKSSRQCSSLIALIFVAITCVA